MIHVFGLAYGVADYVRQSVESILDTAGAPLCLTVIENPSRATPEIEADMTALVEQGRVHRYVQLATNVRGAAYLDVTDRYLARDMGDVYAERDFLVWTDLDLLAPPQAFGVGWADQLTTVMREGVFHGGGTIPSVYRDPPDVAAFALDLGNYVPPNDGHLDTPTRSGVWLMALRRSFLATLARGRVHLDGEICQAAEARGGFLQLPAPRLYHLGWDLWRDAPWYWQEKQRGVPWDVYAPAVIAKVVER